MSDSQSQKLNPTRKDIIMLECVECKSEMFFVRSFVNEQKCNKYQWNCSQCDFAHYLDEEEHKRVLKMIIDIASNKDSIFTDVWIVIDENDVPEELVICGHTYSLVK